MVRAARAHCERTQALRLDFGGWDAVDNLGARSGGRLSPTDHTFGVGVIFPRQTNDEADHEQQLRVSDEMP